LEKVVRCDCGFEARAGHEHRLVAEVQRHALEAHGMALSSKQALLLAFRAELNETTPLWAFIRRTATDPSEDGTSDRKEEK
jgi:Protein of unknown function (DUF1059)